MMNKGRARPRDIPLTKEGFARFKEMLEGERFEVLETWRAEMQLEAARDFGSYRLRVAVAFSLGDGPDRFASFPYRAEARMKHISGSALPGNLISWAFPNARHGNIALRYEEIELSGSIAEAGPYRSFPARTVATDRVDIAHMLRAAEELRNAREEAGRLVSETLSKAVSRKGTPDKAVLELIIKRIRESERIRAAIEEHVPDLP